jgi:DNA polymerase-3 subunit epsilon
MYLTLKNLKLVRPLVVVDVETTGLDPANDRVIELAIIRFQPGSKPATFHSLINPSRSIPTVVSELTRIFDHDVANRPSFADIAADAHRFFRNADIAGFNLSFDLAFLIAEFTLVGRPLPLTNRALIDALTIYRKKEPRDLPTAVQYYLGKPHSQAHSAKSDVVATIQVLDAQLGQYEDLPRTPSQLHAELVEVDLARKFRRDEQGQIVFNFGKYMGQRLGTVAKDDPGYLDWMLSKDFLDDARRVVRDALGGSLA